MLLWFVVSCSCLCRTFTPTANNGSRLAGQSWLAAAFKLMNCLFTITTITTHEENVLFCVTRIRVWLICRSSEILFHLVSKWIKICELKLYLFCLSVNLCGDARMLNTVNGLCLDRSFLTFEHLELSTSLHSITRTQVNKDELRDFKKWERGILSVSGALDLTLMSTSIWRWWLEVAQAFCRVKT